MTTVELQKELQALTEQFVQKVVTVINVVIQQQQQQQQQQKDLFA